MKILWNCGCDTTTYSPDRKRKPMKKTIQSIWALVVDEDGATAIEYGLMAALIAGVIIAAVAAMGTKVLSLFTTTNDRMTW